MPKNSVIYSKLLCQRFEFGVPLEDIFPVNDIHYKLKILFSLAIEAKQLSGLNIEDIIRSSPGKLQECLRLKEKLLQNEQYSCIEFPPVSYLWIVRHFLGQLPLPLLPEYNLNVKLLWNEVASNCHRILKSSKHFDLKTLDEIIAGQINLIPFANFILVYIMMQFMDKICQNDSQRLSRKSAYSIAKYFSSSMFMRPFRPGHGSTEIKPYSSLLFYTIVRWLFIKKHCKYRDLSDAFSGNNCLEKPSYSNYLTEVVPIYKYVPYNCNNNNYLKDVGCQTNLEGDCREKLEDIGDVERKHSSGDVKNSISSHQVEEKCKAESIVDIAQKPEDKDISDAVIENNTLTIKRCCCSYGSQYENDQECKSENNQQIKQLYDTNIVNENEDSASGYYSAIHLDISGPDKDIQASESTSQSEVLCDAPGKFKDSHFNSMAKFHSYGWTLPKFKETPKLSDGYMYDDYDTFQCEEYNQVAEPEERNPFIDVSFLDPLFSDNDVPKSPLVDDLVSKVSKIGWTYTPPVKTEITTGLKTSYQTCFQIKEETHCKKADNKTMNYSNEVINPDLLIDDRSEKSSSQSRKSIISLKNFKVKMDFLKRLKHTKISSSPNFGNCSIKYKKLPKCKSNTF